MEYIDEEERERTFFGKKLAKLIMVVIFLISLIAAVVAIAGNFKKKSISEGNEKQESTEMDLMEGQPANHPFILDDVKDGTLAEVEEKETIQEKRAEVKKILMASKNERICEFAEIDIPEILEAGSLVDVRLSLADGRNYTVLSRKKIGDFMRRDGKEYIWLSLSDLEIITMDSALSDLVLFKNSKLYAVIHSEEETENINVNYPINNRSRKLIKKKEREGGFWKITELILDKELDEDRKRLNEMESEQISRWREAASYWENE